jgi:hypothetical protein
METIRLYRWVFVAGALWNFLIAGMLAVLIRFLPSLLAIEPPRYPLFIYFNLMSIFFFGCMMWIISKDLAGHRSFIKLLAWAKLLMGVIFTYSILADSVPAALTSFLAPGMVVDVVFGLLFWRFLRFQQSLLRSEPATL